MRQRIRGFILSAGLGVLFGLTGCMPSLESSEPPERIYWLDTTTIGNPPVLHLDVSVVPGLDSDRIWILEPDQRLNYYAGALWQDNLRPLLQSVMGRSLNARNSSAGGLTVSVMIERFFAVAGSTGGVPRVEIRARIERSDARNLGCAFESRVAPGTARLRDIVAAHQQLLNELTREVNRVASMGPPGVSC